MTHEEGVVKSFILRPRQERVLGLLSNAKRRRTFTKELAHFKWLDPRFTKQIPPSQQSPSAIFELLKTKGSGQKCWVISESADLEGQELELCAALAETVGRGMGTILSCIPGKLGYFEDEEGRFLLER